MASLFVKPNPGRFVRHETTGIPLPPEGDFWPDSPFLRRRLRDGDIATATAPAIAAAEMVEKNKIDEPLEKNEMFETNEKNEPLEKNTVGGKKTAGNKKGQ